MCCAFLVSLQESLFNEIPCRCFCSPEGGEHESCYLSWKLEEICFVGLPVCVDFHIICTFWEISCHLLQKRGETWKQCLSGHSCSSLLCQATSTTSRLRTVWGPTCWRCWSSFLPTPSQRSQCSLRGLCSSGLNTLLIPTTASTLGMHVESLPLTSFWRL